MFDGIFHQWLQYQGWHHGGQGVGFRVNRHMQPVAETHLLYFQITADKFEFLGDLYLYRPH